MRQLEANHAALVAAADDRAYSKGLGPYIREQEALARAAEAELLRRGVEPIDVRSDLGLALLAGETELEKW